VGRDLLCAGHQQDRAALDERKGREGREGREKGRSMQ
jgi:hypothetical protein